ncbi:MAG: hypothetical protein AABY01_01295, partial [Nanoarchaeota archaeon]
YVDVTYHFNTNNVETAVYDLDNADGSSVSDFSGSFPDGQTTSDGTLTVRYPDSLATPNGYGVYFVSEGYAPLEAKATWNSQGDDSEYTLDLNYMFTQIPACRAVIDQFSITNTAQPNVPVVVSMEASLDGNVQSAFSLTDNQLEYVPSQFKDEFYSADVQVQIQIFQIIGGDVFSLVDTQTEDLTLFADENAPVSFTWTPTVAGPYSAVITTTVVDNQCSSNIQGQSSKMFEVGDSLPRNECYTILNDLAASPQVPLVGETVTMTFNKISNHANDVAFGDSGYVLTPIPTGTTANVNGPGMNTQDMSTLPANSNNVDPASFTFSFTPQQAGMYAVSVTGMGASSMCNGLSNPSDTIAMNVQVNEEPTYSATFQLSDSFSGAKISGAVLNMNGQYLTSDANGQAMFDNLEPGTYAYVITHPNYETLSGTATITDYNQFIFLVMTPGNGTVTPIPTPTPAPAEPVESDVFGIHIDTIRIGDAFEQQNGNDVPFYISFTNNGNRKLHHVEATVVVQELALRANMGPFDLGVGDDETKLL